MSAAVPSTLQVEFGECTIFVSGEVEAYLPQLGGVVAFDGRLDEARIRRAVRLLLDAEPVLGCRFDPDAKPAVWRRLEALEDLEVLSVREADDPAAGAAAFIAEELDPREGPGVVAAILRAPAGDTLAVKVSHIAMDGGALKQTLYRLAEYYRRLTADPDWTPPYNGDGVRYPVLDAGLGERLRLLSKSKVELIPESDWPAPEMTPGGERVYVQAAVEPAVLTAAARKGKSVGATVNDILLTAYFRALYRLLEPEPGSRTPVMTTVDLRRHLPTGTKTALANMSAFWNVVVPPVDGEGFEGALVRVVKATRAWKQAGAGRTDAAAISFASKVMGARALPWFRKQVSKAVDNDVRERRGTVPVLTNIGVVDPTLLVFGDAAPVADAWLLGPTSNGGISLAASTYRDRMHLSSGTGSDSDGRRLLAEVLESVAGEMECWVAASAQ